jgi:hypothetical protein
VVKGFRIGVEGEGSGCALFFSVRRHCLSRLTLVQEIAAAIARMKKHMDDTDAIAATDGSGAAFGGGLLGYMPYQVIARFHRGYIDANRSTNKVIAHLCPCPSLLLFTFHIHPNALQAAFHSECAAAARAHAHYHSCIEKALAEMQQRWPQCRC